MEEANLQHEDLLIKLRAKLNDEKIKLWESPYLNGDDAVSESLQDLAKKYATELSISYEDMLKTLRELQLHSLDRSKANAEFKETGVATINVKARVPGEQMKVIKVQQKLDITGSQLIAIVAAEVNVAETRVKLICNGKIITGDKNLEEQGVKNGAQIMALIMTETPEEAQKKDSMYLEMKTTREDTMLLSECVDNIDNEEYIKLEDQSGKSVELPPNERKALLVALALHERGRAAAKQKDYSLALVLFLEADRQFNECSEGIVSMCDNWALVQLDISWCYLWLGALGAAGDARRRLEGARAGLRRAYGDRHERLIHLKGTGANERVLFMRLYLLQGIVAYHQNKRAEAKELLEKAEVELDALRVDETSLASLMELGWSIGQARTGLRASGGDLERAHHYLTDKRTQRDAARERNKLERAERRLGVCVDGSPVNSALVTSLEGMGYSRRLATAALRNSNNVVSDAVSLIQESPHLLADSDLSSEENANGSDDSILEPDALLIAELQAMGYAEEEAKKALALSRNNINKAVDLLVQGGGKIAEDTTNPSTSSGVQKKPKQKKSSLKKKRQRALARLTAAIKGEEDDHLNSSLHDEEEYLVQYKSLL